MQRDRRPQTFKVGEREFLAHGISRHRWTDVYYHSMTASWPMFFLGAAIVFIVLNCGFGLLYLLGTDPIANVRPGKLIDYFYFSIETLATVGYGDMHPQTDYGHLVATIEIFTGMSFLAVMTGLVFSRFSRPHARFIFAKCAVVADRDSQKTLMIRLANARHNTISGATAKLWLIRAETDQSGRSFRRYYPLSLLRDENPIFALSWTLFHIIDSSSPLYEMTEDDLAKSEATLLLSVHGHDDSSSQELFARHAYSHHDIRWRHRYADITSNRDGRMVIDYTKFHETVEDILPA